MVDAGVRLGKVLTGDHLGGFMRGNFEWLADLMPVYYIWQPVPAKNAYGEAFNPVSLKWNFTPLCGWLHFWNWAAAFCSLITLFPPVPRTSTFCLTELSDYSSSMITSGPYRRRSIRAHLQRRLTVPNPGINSVQFSMGMNWFK